jgi:hypothetical protein
MIVGGYALAFHGAPRFTGDLDILVRPDPENAQRVLSALDEFGFASVGLTKEDFAHPDQIVQLGVPPVRIRYNYHYYGRFLGRGIEREKSRDIR